MRKAIFALTALICLMIVSGCHQQSKAEKMLCAFRQCEKQMAAKYKIAYNCGSMMQIFPTWMKTIDNIQRPSGVSPTRWKNILNTGDIPGYMATCGPDNERCNEQSSLVKTQAPLADLSNQCLSSILKGNQTDLAQFMNLLGVLMVRCNAGDETGCDIYCCRGGISDTDETEAVCAGPCDEEYAEFIETLSAQKKSLTELTREANCEEVQAMGLTCGASFVYLPTMATLNWEWQQKDAAYGQKIWSLALFEMARQISEMPQFDDVEINIDIGDISSFISEINNVYGLTASKTFRDLSPAEAQNVIEKTAAFYTGQLQKFKDPFTKKMVFKNSANVTYSVSIGRIANILTGLTIVLDVLDAVNDKDKIEALAQSPKMLFILDWLYAVLQHSSVAVPGLSLMLQQWNSIPNVAINEAGDAFAKEIIKVSVIGIIAINSGSIVTAILGYAGVGSVGGPGGLLLGLAVGIAVEAGFIAIEETRDYPLYFQMAALLYSIALANSAEQQTSEASADVPLLIVSSLAIETANQFMDKHVVGKIFPKIAYNLSPLNNPFAFMPIVVSASSVIMPAEEQKWQTWLDDYYRRSRFVIVWYTRGSVLLDYLFFYLECLADNSQE